jgi:hypothetical protein
LDLALPDHQPKAKAKKIWAGRYVSHERTATRVGRGFASASAPAPLAQLHGLNFDATGRTKVKFRKSDLLAGSLALLISSAASAQEKDAADVAVEAAKQYAGTTINIVWEAGLQSLDPLNYSGPKWEQLTGIKVKVVEVPTTDRVLQ